MTEGQLRQHIGSAYQRAAKDDVVLLHSICALIKSLGLSIDDEGDTIDDVQMMVQDGIWTDQQLFSDVLVAMLKHVGACEDGP